jgi:hypothetical protein
MFKKIFLICITIAFLCTVTHAKTHSKATPAGAQKPPEVKMLNYYYGLMEYYLSYCEKIGAKELEETDIVMFAGKYILKEKDMQKKQNGMEVVNAKLQKILQGIQKEKHEYRVAFKANLGDYDVMHDGFKCDFVNNYSCLDLAPGNEMGDEGGETRSVIERGLLFGKVSKIKVFFINTEDFKLLKYPADKKDALLKASTDAVGKINKDVYIFIDMAILPKDTNRSNYDKVAKDIYVPGMENNYFMIALVKDIEVYGDMDLKNKLGNVVATDAPNPSTAPTRTLRIQDNF